MKVVVVVLLVMVYLSVFAFAEIKISFWHAFSSTSPRGKALQKMVDDFNNMNVMVGDQKVVVELVYKGGQGKINNPYNVLFSELLKACSQNSTPNISIAYENWVSQLKEIGVIKDFESFNSQKINQYVDSLYPHYREACIIDGKTFSLSFNKSFFVFYYNKKYFSDLNVADLPTNFDQFVNLLREFKQKTGLTPLYLEPNEDTFIIFYLLVASDKFFDITNKIYPTFLGKNLDHTTNVIGDLERQGLIVWTNDSYKDFIDNKAPIILATTSRYTNLKSKSRDYSIASLPADRGRIYSAGTNLVIFKSSPEQETASVKFIEYLIDGKNLEYFCINTGYVLPTMKHTEVYKSFLESNPEYMKVLNYSKDKLYVQPPIWAWENIRYFIADYMFAIFIDKSQVKEQQKSLEEKVNQIMLNQNTKYLK
ncbi:MAG: extracellular solute-binding protein [bacterium]